MQYFQDYKYSLTQVTAIALDQTVATIPYLWVAFAQKNGTCLLKKVSVYNLNQVYYTVQVPCQNINILLVANGFIYVGVTPLSSGIYANAFIFTYSVTNPLSVWYANNRPSGSSALPDVEEDAVALVYDGSTYVYALTPGILSGLVANIVQYISATTTPTPAYFHDLVPMQASALMVTNASTMTIDSSGNLWVATNTNPAMIIETTPGIWGFTETVLL